MDKKPVIAIVGIGGVFPGAGSLDEFWDNIVQGRDLTREPTPGRWLLSLDDVYDATGPLPDKVYSKRACFVDNFRLYVDGLDIDDDVIAGLDPMFQFLLAAGNQAWRDGNTHCTDKHRAGIIIGNIALPTDASSALADELFAPVFDQQFGVSSSNINKINKLNRYVAGLPAGILAKALGLGGGSYTLDAACASSLYALKYAVDELQSGRADAMLAGGLSRPDSLYTQMGFSSLHAISASGHCSPFDHKADGLVVGEGCGMLLLKRLHDAIADDDHIYAVIRGAGLSNDIGGNIMAPDSEGQLRAMRSAYREAGWSPPDVDLIECHGTGTPVGDVVEFNSMKELWGDQHNDQPCVIGSVKSNIGHLLTAAGSAGLIKVLLAMKHMQLPPTANFERANSNIDLNAGPFTVLSKVCNWRQRDDHTPRRAAVSAFGFGGINAHVLLEEWLYDDHEKNDVPHIWSMPAPEAIAIVGMDAAFGPWQSLEDFRRRAFGGDKNTQPALLDQWWGVRNENQVRGYAMDQVEVPVGRFRIPPNELKDMLPQQLLMLLVAANAIEDAGIDPGADMTTTGVYIGIGLDLNTTNFHLRWSLLNKARDWIKRLALTLSEMQMEEWVKDLRGGFYPPLTANRTMGALGGIVASRIARAFNVGGPSFTLSSEETSGLRALEAGVRALQRGDINAAIVGAVDLASDVRAVLGQAEARPYSTSGRITPYAEDADGPVTGDGAAAVIMKREADARRDGDRIYAVIKGIGSAGGGRTDAVIPASVVYQQAVNNALSDAGTEIAAISYIEAHGSGCPIEDSMELEGLSRLFNNRESNLPCALGSVKGDIGHAGAAGGMAEVIRAALCLHQHLLPPMRNLEQPRSELCNLAGKLFAPRQRQYWLRNKINGPRQALVNAVSIDGNCVSAVVTEAAEPFTASIFSQPDSSEPALFCIDGDNGSDILSNLDQLSAIIKAGAASTLTQLAGNWFRNNHRPGAERSLSLVVSSVQELQNEIVKAKAYVTEDSAVTTGPIYYSPQPLGTGAGIAFVFPGSGNHFQGMGREAAARWPQVLERLDAENDALSDQFAKGQFWTGSDPATLTHQDVIFGQVWLGTMMSDIVAGFGVRPDAVIGYSLGETAGLFATRAWTGRDKMLQRMKASPLFVTDLAGACHAARKAWGLGRDEKINWLVGVVDRSAGMVREKLNGRQYVYLLIINTEKECVIGGENAAVLSLVKELGCHFHPISGVTTVHCEVVKAVEKFYRELHLFETRPPAGIRYYSGALGRSYELNSDSAADSITGQALQYFDYPKVINNAYADGLRIFIEMGPGATCTRMIDQILGDRRHIARAVCVRGQSETANIIRLLAQLNTERAPLDLSSFYNHPNLSVNRAAVQTSNVVTVPVGKSTVILPRPAGQKTRSPKQLSAQSPITNHESRQIPSQVASNKLQGAEAGPHAVNKTAEIFELQTKSRRNGLMTQIIDQAMVTEAANAQAQAAFLRVANGINASLAQAFAMQSSLLQNSSSADHLYPVFLEHAEKKQRSDKMAVHDRDQCLEFAIGSIAKVLGPRYQEIDGFPTRVRLPDEPLMLVDRILEVDGEPCSMDSGRVMTEHDIRPETWYLDGGRIPTCIAVEAGQADLFLSGYLGIDLQTRGLAMYRLLDAEVTFHGPLPRSGQTIRYNIHIDQFFRQGDTWLFRFRFDGSVDGRPVISMHHGCAGFFTHAELDAGQGIVLTSLERRTLTGRRPDDWSYPIPMHNSSYNDEQIDALRRGDLAGCFGPDFAGLSLQRPAGLPGGRMTLVHRVLDLDPAGGRYGLGSITGEADIHPDDWFLTCHFVDDQVMPGTLMYECCLHTLRIYLLRLGWVGEADAIVYEPMPGVTGKLKCRGQVTASTRKVQYEITLKEYGYMPEGTPYAIADALMYADGRAIVQMTDMSLLLSGLKQAQIQKTWTLRTGAVPGPVLFDHHSILAFATGKPSQAFGDRYRVFDHDRVIARLPGPPYQFLDRITLIENCEPWQLRAGGVIEAEYDVPPDAWYFEENRQPCMPFAVLLEVALQPCGWLAAYLGSALTSDLDLSFRNLGGRATQYLQVTAATGTIVTRIRITDVSRSGGMIIQHFDYDLHGRNGRIYQGNTYFGFFTKDALANQIGLRDTQLYTPGVVETERGRQFDYPDRPPYPGPMLRMIDHITLIDPQGGPRGLGYICGTARVNPDAWFFKAHFYQDPVWPGSLGLESFIQLLKVAACHLWGQGGDNLSFESMATGQAHAWTYRGQIIPGDNEVTVQAVITDMDYRERLIRADGFLCVDGRIIYQMQDFALRILG